MDEPANRGGDGLFCVTQRWVQKAWDNSSLAMFKACPRKYQLGIIEGWRPQGAKGALEFGSMYHKGLEVYDKAKVEGLDHTNAQRRMIHTVLNHWCKDGMCLPWETGDTKRTKQTLIRSLVWYTDQFENDAAKTVVASDGKPAIELSFRLELPLHNPDGDPYLWCGHIDKLVTFGGFHYILERKHTGGTVSSYYFDRFSPNSQVSGYATAVDIILNESVAGTIIDAAQVMVNGTRFQRGIAPRTRAQKQEWLQATLHWIEKAEACAINGYWPMNEESCGNYGGCQFREVCSKDPGARLSFLNAAFVKEPWNPLENRD